MRYSHKARGIIIRYIKDSMNPITEGEILWERQLANRKGKERRWFLDILEGDASFICLGKSGKPDDEAYTYVKLHYIYDWPFERIAYEYKIPKTSLQRKMDKFFSDLVENMELDLGNEILRIHDRHKIEEIMGELAPRWTLREEMQS